MVRPPAIPVTALPAASPRLRRDSGHPCSRIARRAILLALLSGLLPGAARAQLSLTIDSVTVAYPTVRLTVRVTDGGAPVRNLSVPDFTVLENGAVQAPIRGGCDDTVSSGPVSVLLIMDKSNSMGPLYGNAIVAAKAAASGFVDRLSTSDEAALLSFNTAVSYDQSWTNNKALLKSRINGIFTSGGTRIWNAVIFGENLLGSRANTRVMILLTDGQDNDNNVDFTLALNTALADDITVYTIGLGSDIDATVLRQIATATGGRYYNAPDASDLDQIYAAISSELSPTGVCRLEYDSRMTCLDGSLATVEVHVAWNGQNASASAQYRLPVDSTTFSYLTLALDEASVVESDGDVAVPVRLTRLSRNRPQTVLDFDVAYNGTLLLFRDVATTALTASYQTQSTLRNGGVSIRLSGGSALTDTGVVALLRFSASHTETSRKSALSLTMLGPSFTTSCTVLESVSGIVTVSGACQRAVMPIATTAPPRTEIVSNAPNPFNPGTVFRYAIRSAGRVSLVIFDVAGRRVATVVDDVLPAGTYESRFDGSALASGTYYARLRAGGDSSGRTVVVSK